MLTRQHQTSAVLIAHSTARKESYHDSSRINSSSHKSQGGPTRRPLICVANRQLSVQDKGEPEADDAEVIAAPKGCASSFRTGQGRAGASVIFEGLT